MPLSLEKLRFAAAAAFGLQGDVADLVALGKNYFDFAAHLVGLREGHFNKVEVGFEVYGVFVAAPGVHMVNV